MERWRYVFVSAKPTGAAPKSKRDGWGSARALQPSGSSAHARRREGAGDRATAVRRDREAVEARFGAATVDELRQALAPVIGGLDVEFLSISRSSHRATGWSQRSSTARERRPRLTCPRCSRSAPRLHARLRAKVGAVVAAHRELRARPRQDRPRCPETRVRRRSKEATAMAVKFLKKTVREGRGEARPPDGQRLEAQAAAAGLHAEVERGWKRGRCGKP